MYTKKCRNLLKDNLKRTLNIKYRYVTILNKSLFHNRRLAKDTRTIIFKKLSFKKKNIRRLKNVCLISGENTSVNKKLMFTRFQINYLSIVNKLPNFRVNS